MLGKVARCFVLLGRVPQVATLTAQLGQHGRIAQVRDPEANLAQSRRALRRAVAAKLVSGLACAIRHERKVARYRVARNRQAWMGLPRTAIAASFIASECVGWAWQV